MATMPKSSSAILLIGELPIEVLQAICIELDLPALENLRLVSKAWKRIIDSEALLRMLCVREGLLSSLSQSLEDLKHLSQPLVDDEDSDEEISDAHLFSKLRLKGCTDKDLSSSWSLLRARALRNRGLPFDGPIDSVVDDSALPTLHRVYQRPVPDEYLEEQELKLMIDHIDRVLIAFEPSYDGLRVICLDTGKLLWFDKRLSYYSSLKYSEGWVIVEDYNEVIIEGESDYRRFAHVLRFDRLCHSPGWHSGGLSSDGRGYLHEHATFLLPSDETVGSRFHFPYLLSMTDDLLVVFDVRDQTVHQQIDLRPAVAPARMNDAQFVSLDSEFDDEYYIVMSVWRKSPVKDSSILQVFYRQTGRLIWSMDWRSLLDNCTPQEYVFEDRQTFEVRARWDRSGHQRPGPSSCGPDSYDEDGGPRDPQAAHLYPASPHFSKPHIDEATNSLCLLWATKLVIFPDYKARLKENAMFGGGTNRFEQPIVLAFPSMSRKFHWSPHTLAINDGLASFALDRSIVIIDLQKLLSDQPKFILRFILPDYIPPQDPSHDDPHEKDACYNIQIDRSIMVFDAMSAQEVGNGRHNIHLLGFARMGRIRMDEKKMQNEEGEKHKVVEVPSSVIPESRYG